MSFREVARAWDLVRQDLTARQAMFVRWGLVLLAIGMIDTIAIGLWQMFYQSTAIEGWDSPTGDAIKLSPFVAVVLVPVARWLLKQVGPVDPKVADRPHQGDGAQGGDGACRGAAGAVCGAILDDCRLCGGMAGL